MKILSQFVCFVLGVAMLPCAMGQSPYADPSARRDAYYRLDRLFSMDEAPDSRVFRHDETALAESLKKAFKREGVDLSADPELKIQHYSDTASDIRIKVSTTRQFHKKIWECLHRFHREELKMAAVAPAASPTALATKQWKVPVSFFEGDDSPGTDAVEMLKMCGISFPRGATASYDTRKEILSLTNTAQELSSGDNVVTHFLHIMPLTPQPLSYGAIGEDGLLKAPYLVEQLKSLLPKSSKVDYKSVAYLLCAAPNVASSPKSGELKTHLQRFAAVDGVAVILVVADKKDAAWAKKASYPSIQWDKLIQAKLGADFPDPFFKMGRCCFMNPHGGKVRYAKNTDEMTELAHFAAGVVSTADAAPKSAKKDAADVPPAKANAAWLKRQMARQKKAVDMVKKIKNERSCKAAITKLKKLYGIQGGMAADPCPYPEEEGSSPMENKKMAKLAFAMGNALNRLNFLVAEGKVEAESFDLLYETVASCCLIAEDGSSD